MSTMRIIQRYLIGLVATWAACPVGACAASFTIPLFPIAATAADGGYLTSTFDFGTAFSQVESLTLEFVMPGGFEGSAATTGNSSYFRSLAFVLHDAATPITTAWPVGTENVLTQTAMSIPAAVPVRIGLGNLSLSLSGMIVEPTWPEFVLRGQGRLAWIEVSESTFHPLPEGIVVRSTTTWQPPAGITAASLTIVGTPVPEPNSILMFVIGAGCYALVRVGRRTTNGLGHVG